MPFDPFMRRVFGNSHLGTAAITQPEQLTQRKSKRPIEGFVCNPLFVDYNSASKEVHVASISLIGSISDLRTFPVIGKHPGEPPILLFNLLDHDMDMLWTFPEDSNKRFRDVFDNL